MPSHGNARTETNWRDQVERVIWYWTAFIVWLAAFSPPGYNHCSGTFPYEIEYWASTLRMQNITWGCRKQLLSSSSELVLKLMRVPNVRRTATRYSHAIEICKPCTTVDWVSFFALPAQFIYLYSLLDRFVDLNIRTLGLTFFSLIIQQWIANVLFSSLLYF